MKSLLRSGQEQIEDEMKVEFDHVKDNPHDDGNLKTCGITSFMEHVREAC